MSMMSKPTEQSKVEQAAEIANEPQAALDGRDALRDEVKERWGSKTSAELVTGAEFDGIKARDGLHVVGVTGFSGQWSEAKIAADPAIKADVEGAVVAIENKLAALKEQYSDKLIVSSGATNEGVPKLIYDACEKLEIVAMGVTSEKAYDYELGKMKYLIVEGRDWGEESATFLRTSDELLMLGGGGQAKREAIAAGLEGKPVTVFRGFKGSADQLTAEDLMNVIFVDRT